MPLKDDTLSLEEKVLYRFLIDNEYLFPKLPAGLLSRIFNFNAYPVLLTLTQKGYLKVTKEVSALYIGMNSNLYEINSSNKIPFLLKDYDTVNEEHSLKRQYSPNKKVSKSLSYTVYSYKCPRCSYHHLRIEESTWRKNGTSTAAAATAKTSSVSI